MKFSKEQKVELYGQGFRDGAAGHPMSALRYPAEYLRGYGDGQKAFCAAMDMIRKELKCPLLSYAMGSKDKYGHEWEGTGTCVCPFKCIKCGALSGTDNAFIKCKSSTRKVK